MTSDKRLVIKDILKTNAPASYRYHKDNENLLQGIPQLLMLFTSNNFSCNDIKSRIIRGYIDILYICRDL